MSRSAKGLRKGIMLQTTLPIRSLIFDAINSPRTATTKTAIKMRNTGIWFMERKAETITGSIKAPRQSTISTATGTNRISIKTPIILRIMLSGISGKDSINGLRSANKYDVTEKITFEEKKGYNELLDEFYIRSKFL